MLATLRVRAGSARSIATRLPFRKHTCATLTTKRYLSSTSAGTDEPDRGIPTPPTPLSIDGLLYASDAVRIRQVLEKETRDTISWSEFMGVVDSLGIPSQRGSHIAEDLQHTGIILFTEAGVCLRPASLLSAITSPPPGAFTPAIAPRRAATPRRAVAELDTKARTSAQRVFVGGGVLLTLQNLVLFRLTYWELGWDAVEPMTYFANAAGVLAWCAPLLVAARHDVVP